MHELAAHPQAAELGTTTVWVAFHGIGTEHDRQVNRHGAWAETCLAVQRVHAVGLRAGANVFVTTANAGQAGRLLGAWSAWRSTR
jgi:MoaA/NifB/PqqE/SkfB family radical SAM enzyme